MRVEDEHLDVLQNIEAEVISVYQEHRQMTDYDVDKAYAALIKMYRSGSRARAADRPGSELPGLVYDRVSAVCDWRLGRISLIGEDGTVMPDPEPVTLEVITLCLKRLRRSVEKWTKESGRQGYLNFISKFL